MPLGCPVLPAGVSACSIFLISQPESSVLSMGAEAVSLGELNSSGRTISTNLSIRLPSTFFGCAPTGVGPDGPGPAVLYLFDFLGSAAWLARVPSGGSNVGSAGASSALSLDDSLNDGMLNASSS